MMKKVRSFVAIFVVIATVLSLCPFAISVAAEEEASVETNVEITESDLLLIEKLEAFGMITNEFEITDTVTRRQMAKIIAKYMLMSDGSSSKQSPFRDVSVNDSDFPVINSLYEMGIVRGDERFNFNPEQNVTYREALVFVINAVGHKVFAEREGGYPTGYLRTAIKYGMLKNLNMQSDNEAISLIDVYKLLDSASLSATIVIEYNGDDTISYTLSDTENYLSTMYGIKKYRGQVTGNENTYLTSPNSNLTDEQISIGANKKIYETPGYIYGYFLGYTVDYYLKKTATGYTDLMYVEETPKSNSVVRLDADKIQEAIAYSSSSRICILDEKGKEEYYDLKQNIDVIYNGQNYKGYLDNQFTTKVLPVNGYVELLDNNNDGTYDVLFSYSYRSYIATSVDTYKEEIHYETGVQPIDVDAARNKINVVSAETNEKVNLSSLEAGDILSVAESKGTNKVVTIYVSRKTVSGQIEAYDTELGYLIGGDYYKADVDYNTYNPGYVLNVGLSGVFYLDMNNRIVKYEYDAATDTGVLGVMSGIDYENSLISNKIEVRIYTAGKTFLQAELSSKVRIDNVPYDLENPASFNAAVGAIANDAPSSVPRSVISAYIVKYTTGNDGKIKALDLGGIGGKGRLNVTVDEADYMVLRPSSKNMIAVQKKNVPVYDASGNPVLNGDGTQKTETTTNYSMFSSSGVIFFAPYASADLGDISKYGMHTFKNEKIYSNYVESYTNLNNLSIYSFENSDVPITDAILMRGYNESTYKGSPKVYTHVTDVIDEDGIACKKLYQDQETIGILAETLEYRVGGTVNPAITTPAQVLAAIEPGDIIECEMNSDEKINEIDVLATYDEFTSVLTATTSFTAEAYNRAQEDDYEFIATIDNIDAKNGIVEVTVSGSGKVFVLDGSGAMVACYDTTRNKMVSCNLAELHVGETAMFRMEKAMEIKNIVVFRR